MANVSQGKAKDILTHGEVRGHPLTRAQRGYFGARAAGLPEKNAPLFPLPREEGFTDFTPQEREPLSGPSEAFVGDPPSRFGGQTGEAFDGRDVFKVNAPHPSEPINDGDFPSQAVFDKGTRSQFDPGGLV